MIVRRPFSQRGGSSRQGQPVFFLVPCQLGPARFVHIVHQDVFHLESPLWILSGIMFRYYNDVRNPAIWTAAPRYLFRVSLSYYPTLEDVADGAVQADVIVMLDVAPHQPPRIIKRASRLGRHPQRIHINLTCASQRLNITSLYS